MFNRETKAMEWNRTGRIKYRVAPLYIGIVNSSEEKVLNLMVEEEKDTTIGGVTRTETRWRYAEPKDIDDKTLLDN